MSFNFKSTIKKTKDFDYSQPIVIDRLIGDDNAFYAELNKAVKQFKPKLESKQINDFTVHQIVSNNYLVWNVITTIKTILKNYYEIITDQDEVNNVINDIKKQKPDGADDVYNKIANDIIYENLLFLQLASEWNITITDQELEDNLQKQYEEFNIPIRDIKNNEVKLNAYRNSLLIKRIQHVEILKHFNISVKLSLSDPIGNWKIIYLPNQRTKTN